MTLTNPSLSICLIFQLLSRAQGLPPGPANIAVTVYTAFGAPLRDVRVALVAVGSSQQVVKFGGTAVFDNIQEGPYDIVANLTGFSQRTERVYVYQRQSSYHLGLDLVSNHSYSLPLISGTVRPSVPGLRARLVPLFSGGLVENDVDEHGRFEIAGMAPGSYILILHTDRKIVTARNLEVFEGTHTVTIDNSATSN